MHPPALAGRSRPAPRRPRHAAQQAVLTRNTELGLAATGAAQVLSCAGFEVIRPSMLLSLLVLARAAITDAALTCTTQLQFASVHATILDAFWTQIPWKGLMFVAVAYRCLDVA